MILAGDIGGTKSNLALYEVSGGRYRKLTEQRFESREFAAFEQVIAKFLKENAATANLGTRIEAAGFGIAGPVSENRVKATNLPWIIEGAAVAAQLSTPHVVLLNDLEATAHSVALLGPSELAVLSPGKVEGNPTQTHQPRTTAQAMQSTQSLIAAGTGLGESILFWDGQRHVVAATEGGHTDFAPRTEQEIGLLRHMKKSHEFVSWELILSGRGFRTIHEFLDAGVLHPSFSGPEADSAPEITRLGMTGQCPVCVETLNLWVSIYGAEAGNLALKTLSRGGVWIAGGIAVKIRSKMEDGTFVRAFCQKEQFGELLKEIPVKMILNEDAPLLGAMSRAALSVSSGER